MKNALKEALDFLYVLAETSDGTVEPMVKLDEAIKCVDDILCWQPYPECKPSFFARYRYLVTVDCGDVGLHVDIAFWDGDEDFLTMNMKTLPNVIAWMPLPEPYEGGEE